MPQVFPSCVVATGGDDGFASKMQNPYVMGFYVVFVLLILWLHHKMYSHNAHSPFTTSSDLQWAPCATRGATTIRAPRTPTARRPAAAAATRRLILGGRI